MTSDHSSREVARKRLDVNIVVEAGAGTGKTTLLTDRLLFLLLAGGPEQKGLSITRMVALTFTEKAAGEIKVRLAERLNDLLRRLDGHALLGKGADRIDQWLREAREEWHATDDRIRHMAEEALRELDRAPIGTIHSFCKTLIQLFPVEAGVNPQFQMDKGDALEALFKIEWNRWLEKELVLGTPTEPLWRDVLTHVPLDDVATLAKALAGSPAVDGHSALLSDRLAALREALDRLPEGKPLPRRGKMLESIRRLSERFQSVESVARNPWGPMPVPAEWKEDAKKWPKEWEGLDGESVYQEACALSKGISPEGEAALARVRKLLAPFVAHCRSRFRAEGWMGFDDLLRGARDLLADHPEVRRELKTRYGAILIDEFQDTDPLQGEMLLFLAERLESEARTWRDVLLAPGKLFIVGDPKQSIYRFRGADIRAYEAFVSLVLSQGGQKCDLQTSFRTHSGIVEPVNRLFADLMRESPGLQPAYLPLLPRPGEGGSGGVELALVEGGEDTPSGQEAEARWIARWVVDHCGAEGDGRPWRLGDVAVLFRSTSVLTTYMDALKAAKIPYLVESDRAFYSTPEVMDFLNLLRVIQNPSDTVSLVGLLRSPLILLEDRHILQLAEAGGLDDRRPLPSGLPEDVAVLSEFYGELGRLRKAAQGDSLGELAARLLREPALLPAAAAVYHGEQSVSNLMKLARLAAEANDARGETVEGFVRRLSESVGDGVEEGESPLGEERADAVRLLTVHKAKGLEYKVVFLPNLSAAVQSGSRRTSALRQDWAEGRVGHRLVERKWSDLGMAFLDADERRREKEEAIRLFYVAATRAREHVILLGNQKAASGSFMEMLQGSSHPVDGAWELVDGLRLPVTIVSPVEGKRLRWAAEMPNRKSHFTTTLERQWEKRMAQGAAVAGTPLFRSPSTKAHEPEKLEWTEGATRLPKGDAALLGRLCHGVLEFWEWSGRANVSAAVERAADRLSSEFPAAQWGDIRREAVDLLSGFFDSPVGRQLGAHTILARETPFLFAEEGTVVRGVIDLLYRRDGKLWVADFKTDRLKPGESLVRAERYAHQGRDYRTAVQRSLNEPCGFEIIFLRTAERVDLTALTEAGTGDTK